MDYKVATSKEEMGIIDREAQSLAPYIKPYSHPVKTQKLSEKSDQNSVPENKETETNQYRNGSQEYRHNSPPNSKIIIGPTTIQGWKLHDVNDIGNCFFEAIEHQLELYQHSYLEEAPGTAPHDRLRLLVQGDNFSDREWVGNDEFIIFTKKFNAALAIVDTRYPERGYTCYLPTINEQGEVEVLILLDNQNAETLIQTNNIFVIRIATTGNHFLSVISNPTLTHGALLSSFDAPNIAQNQEQNETTSHAP